MFCKVLSKTLLKKSKVELVKFEDKTVKGANGEKLKHILLRIVG